MADTDPTRPPAGRDLTADDVRLALVGMGYYPPVDDAHYAVANYLNGIARPTAEVRGMFGPGDGVGQGTSRVDWGGYEPAGYYDRRSISELIARSSLGCPNVPNCGSPIGDHHVDDWNLDGDPINPRCP